VSTCFILLSVKFNERREFGIQYRSPEFEVEMHEETSCARTHCCKLCVAPKSRAKTAKSFTSIHFGLHIFHWRACLKGSGRHFDHLIWWNEGSSKERTDGRTVFYWALRSFRTELLTLVSDFAALCLCQQWLYLACFLLWLQLNTTHQYNIWNVCFLANFRCCNIVKYFKDRSTIHQVIAKIKKGARFFETRCI